MVFKPTLTDEELIVVAQAFFDNEQVSAKGAKALGMSPSTFKSRLAKAKKRSLGPFKDYVPPEPAKPATPAALDKVRRLEADLREARSDVNRIRKRMHGLQDIRSAAFGLAAEPLPPKRLKGRDIPTHRGGRTVILHLSDTHMGEFIDINQMDGLNSFSIDIARNRTERFFTKAAALMTHYWQGTPPERIVLMLGGDMIAGDLHPELTRTNEVSSLASVREMARCIVSGIQHLKIEVSEAQIDVYHVDGNHGRLTMKPEAKGFAENSMDRMCTYMVEMGCAGLAGVSFHYADGPDCLFDVYGRNILLTHGDRIGSRGGQGFIGPIATILRGMRRIQSDYASRGLLIYRIFLGHFHTSSSLPFGYSNGSLPGPSEYGLSGRMDFEPAQQNMVVIHSELGVIEERKLLVGSGEEGSIYTNAA